MKSSDILKDAISNTARSKVRTSLTVIAIFIGASTLTLTNSIGAGISSYIDNQIGALGNDSIISVNKPVEENQTEGPVKYQKSPAGSGESNIQRSAAQMGVTIDFLNDSDLEHLRDIDNVINVEPTLITRPDYIQGDNGEQYTFSTNPVASLTDPDLKIGAGFSSDSDSKEVILPASYVQPLGYDNDESIIGESVTIGITDTMGGEHTVEANVVGVQNKSLFGDTVSLNQKVNEELSEAQKTGMPTTDNLYISATLTLKSDIDEEGIEEVRATLTDKGYEGSTIADQLGTVQAVINGLIGVLNAFAIITLIAASFGIMNTLLMSVKERTREIGLMKAMGMSNRKVFGLFSTEAVFIGFLGSALGAGAAIVIGSIASQILSTTLLADLEGLTISLFTVPDVLTIILVVMGIAFLSGTVPAARAAKQNPIDALRYE